MPSALAVVIDENGPVREEARQMLSRAGIEVVAVATPREASEVLKTHPHAVVVAFPEGPATPKGLAQLAMLCRMRAEERTPPGDLHVQGRSEAAEALRRRLRELAESETPVLFAGEKGSGRSHAARCLHALANASGPFLVVPADDPAALDIALTESESTVFVPSIEHAAWSAQDRVASVLASGKRAVRFMASTAGDPVVAADEGLLSPALFAAFAGGIVRVPALRERATDVPVLAQTFLEELRRLNGLPPIAIADASMAALQAYGWPGNVRQLRSAIESAVTLAEDGVLRSTDLPEFVRGGAAAAEPGGQADRRFRDAKRLVVEAFERSYLGDLLRRHGGNVTGAAEQSGMLRSALQRLLRKHDLHSADFRRRGGPDRYAS